MQTEQLRTHKILLANEIKQGYQRHPIKAPRQYHEAFSNMAGESTLHYLFSPIILRFRAEFYIYFLFQILIFITETAMKTLTMVSFSLIFVIDPVTSTKMLRSKKLCHRSKHQWLCSIFPLKRSNFFLMVWYSYSQAHWLFSSIQLMYVSIVNGENHVCLQHNFKHDAKVEPKVDNHDI